MSPRTRLLSISAVAAVAVASPFVLKLYSSETKVASAAAIPPLVTTSTVETRTLVESEEVIGRVEATEFVDLRAEVSGRIEEVHFNAGTRVLSGQPLFTLDRSSYKAAFDAAQAAVGRAEANAKTANREAARYQQLLAREAISSEEAEARRSKADEALADLMAAKAALTQAQINLDRTVVRAPISGRVSRALVTVGNLVSPATPLTTVVSTGRAHVYAAIPEATALRYQRLSREGRLARDAHGRIAVSLALADESSFQHSGYIESSDNRLEADTGTLLVRMEFDDPDELLTPGLFARVRLPLGEPNATLLVADRAIGTDQSQKFVLTVDETGKVAYRAVLLGGVIDGKRIIRGGLSAGDRVIVNGLQRVRPGMSVHPQPEASEHLAQR